MSNIFTGVVLFLIILILYKYTNYCREKQDSFLSGIWSGDAEFLKQSNLKTLHLMIAPIRDSGKLKGFLSIVDNDGSDISNQIIWLDNSAFNNKVSITYTDPEFDAIPSNVTINVDINKGTMMIYADSKLYAFLVKNNEMSMISNETYENPS